MDRPELPKQAQVWVTKRPGRTSDSRCAAAGKRAVANSVGMRRARARRRRIGAQDNGKGLAGLGRAWRKFE
jgi:hypothetical protein